MNQEVCPFCRPDAEQIFHVGTLVLGLWDKFPVSPGHALLVTCRHVADWFDASDEERAELVAATMAARANILERHHPSGFNIGINVGEAGGQTVPHLHVHVIPRYDGDVDDPRGGVRFVIPGNANYLSSEPQVRDSSEGYGRPPGQPEILGWEDKPLFASLTRDLAKARDVDMAVAFILESGLKRIEQHLFDVLDRDGRIRILTGDYLDVTEPRALHRLLDLKTSTRGSAEIRVFQTTSELGFHPKTYLVHDRAAYVGSSNLSKRALEQGIEWNYRVSDPAAVTSLRAEFERLFVHPRTTELTPDWIQRYEASRKPDAHAEPHEVAGEVPPPPPTPHEVQQRALAALAATRAAGNRAGLVVLATGLGKTWLSAFDSVAFNRVLFVAHREEILRQAQSTFRAIRPEAVLGHYTGESKDLEADVVFASVQTLGKKAHLDRFERDAFDYIVVDEFHHAAASTYRRLIDYFEPQFLLGLTATPDRTDGADLLALCGGNLVFRCDLVEGINGDLLAPFRYFGVPDEVEYDNIPWRSGRFDPEALETAVATSSRAENAWQQWQEHKPARTLAFCVSKRHADFMRDFFSERDVSVAAVHSGEGSDPRAESLEELADGKLQVVFAVDMFNEGVDIPSVDAVLMLRPTESRLLWLQQIGRGLRKAEGKSHLTIIDYIGNHRTFLKSPMTLLPGAEEGRAQLAMALEQNQRGELELPNGCSITYDLAAIDILRDLARLPKGAEALRIWYQDFEAQHGYRPSATEAWTAGYDPASVRTTYGSWLGFVKTMGGLDENQTAAFDASKEFYEALEKTQMTKSYKMLVLLSMIAEGRFPGAIDLDQLTEAFAHQANRTTLLRNDVGTRIDDKCQLQKLIVDHPIRAWVGGKATGSDLYFVLDGQTFRTTALLDGSRPEQTAEFTRELCEWRLAQYVERIQGENSLSPHIVCKVSHSGGSPILFLPDRNRQPGIPEGYWPVMANNEMYRFKFVKIAINVAERAGSEKNELPDLLRGWFGLEAGQPGRDEHVVIELEDGTYKAAPRESPSEPVVGSEYMRANIPSLFGIEYQQNLWRQGFIKKGNHLFLLVTLEKAGMQEAHRYADHFLSPDLFEWQSQNQTKRDTNTGKLIRDHANLRVKIHLFVRKTGKTPRGTATPFTYCGDVDFVDWERDQPIAVRWRLRNPLRAGHPFLSVKPPHNG